jgi:serine protease
MMRRALVFVLICLVLAEGGAAYAAAPNDPYWSLQWHMRTIRADRAWARSRGSGIVVAVVDTGVDLAHPDLRQRISSGIDLVNPGSSAQDEQGHGTFMAGIIAASTGNNIGVGSVAPLARIMPVRVLNEDGTGEPSTVAAGIDWAVSHGADVINLSLAQEPLGGSGGPVGNLFGDPAMDRAIENAAQAGALVVAAAGNDFSSGGSSTTSYDATVEGVLVVGASTKSDRRAAYSNYGSGLDVLAPGGGSSSNPSNSGCQSSSPVVSTWWDAGVSKYGQGCGTSMGVAHVSGIGALLMARGYSNVSAARRIRNTTKDLYGAGRDSQSGWGRVDAAAAVGATSVAPKPSTKPKPRSQPPRRSVVPAAKPPAVKGAKVPQPTGVPTPIRGVTLSAAVPYHVPSDIRLQFIALALAMAVGVGVGHAAARRASWSGR